MRRSHCFFAAVFLCAFPIGTAPAADADAWPQFRGPTGQGISQAEGLPTQWSTTKTVAWKFEVPGQGWSSPIFVDGRVYLTSAIPVPESENEDYTLEAFCLDAANGRTVWRTVVFRQDGETAPSIHNKNSHASPTPIVRDGRIYVHFGHQGTACLDVEGNVVWRNDQIDYNPVHGNGGSPVLTDDAVVFSVDGREQQFIIALDRKTGRQLWKTERDVSSFRKFSFSTPLVIDVDGEQQIVSPGTDSVWAYHPETGEVIWRVKYEGYSVVPRPVYGHGMVYVATGFNTPKVMAIRPTGSGDVTETHVAWEVRRGAPHTPSLLLVGDELYMVSDRGVATCLDAKSGEQVWQERVGGNYSASPLYADDKIYLQSEQGEAVVIKAGREFEEIARNSLDERTFASYAVGDGGLFIRTETRLYRIE